MQPRSKPSAAGPARAARSRGRPRDHQRAKVYRWEGAWVMPRDERPLSLDACRRLVAEVFHRRLGPTAAPPVVHDGRGRRHAAGSRDVIKLPRWARTRPVVLHECAHGLATDGHGPDYVRQYVELLVDFMGFDRTELENSLASANIAITPRGAPITLPTPMQPPPVTTAPAPTPRVGGSLLTRLLAVGIDTSHELSRIGPVEAWIRLRRRFGAVINAARLVEVTALALAIEPHQVDGRTRARLRFEASGRMVEEAGGLSSSWGPGRPG